MAVKRYDGSAWQVVAGKGDQGTSSSIATWVKTASGGETSLSGNDDNSQPLSYTVGQELVFINGALQKRGVDYTATTGTSITGLTALVANDVVTVWTVNAFSVANTYTQAQVDAAFVTGADTPGILSVGSNDQVLTADSSTGTGLKWAAPAGGLTWTLINTGGTSLTGAATITVSGISDKEYILVLVDQASSASADSIIGLRINTDTGTNYSNFGGLIAAAGTYVAANFTINAGTTQTYQPIGRMSSTGGSVVAGGAFITGGKSTGIKSIQSMGAGTADGNNQHRNYTLTGIYNGSAALTSVSLFSDTGNFDAGTLYVYGA